MSLLSEPSRTDLIKTHGTERTYDFGIYGGQRWGFVEKCPWCDAVNVEKTAPNMITCGRERCKVKQRNHTISVGKKRKRERERVKR